MCVEVLLEKDRDDERLWLNYERGLQYILTMDAEHKGSRGASAEHNI